jgi:hypothetical protein
VLFGVIYLRVLNDAAAFAFPKAQSKMEENKGRSISLKEFVMLNDVMYVFYTCTKGNKADVLPLRTNFLVEHL